VIRSRALDQMDIKSAMALIALNPKISCKRSLPVPWEARKRRPIMRLTEIVFALTLTLTVATPTFAQSPQTGAGSPTSHSTASPTQGSTTATRASTSFRQFKTDTEASRPAVASQSYGEIHRAMCFMPLVPSTTAKRSGGRTCVRAPQSKPGIIWPATVNK
jgi:hypothetical protein